MDDIKIENESKKSSEEVVENKHEINTTSNETISSPQTSSKQAKSLLF